ncbi:alpha-amylase [Hyaloraphidium curvatum]|nr:alpha-amylase [Hyaloraphidium curvatum]
MFARIFNKYYGKDEAHPLKAGSDAADADAAAAKPPPRVNGVLFQSFHWWTKNDGTLWKEIAQKAPELAKLGITSVWLPPASKGAGGVDDVGYAVYDLYDLGNYDQKGAVRTKYGTKEELKAAVKALHDNGIQAYLDIVFNQRQGADERELVKIQEYAKDNRNQPIGDAFEGWIWTKFNCKSLGKDTNYQFTKDSFDTVGWVEWQNEDGSWSGREGVFKIVGTETEQNVSLESGNYDFLCADDLRMSSPAVVQELINFTLWVVKEIGIDGFRIDAVKHIDATFFRDFIYTINERLGRKVFAVGEYYSNAVDELQWYLGATNYVMSVFGFALRNNLAAACRQPGYDMRNLIDGTLVERAATNVVTFLDNHDVQPLREAHDTYIEFWMRTHGYALILLREEGYPCVFYPDVYGAEYTDVKPGTSEKFTINLAPVQALPLLLQLRRDVAWGFQHEYFHFDDPLLKTPNPDPNVVGWTREGDADHPGSGLACLLSKEAGGSKWMFVGKHHAGETWKNALNLVETSVVNSDGFVECKVGAGQVSVYVPSTYKI